MDGLNQGRTLPAFLPEKPAGKEPRSLAARLRLWRSGLIASPAFRRLAARLPLLRRIANRKANGLFRLTTGFVHSRLLGACVRFGIFDLLADRGLSTATLADATGLTPARLRLLLEQAQRLDLVIEAEPDLWMLDDAGAVIAGDPGLAAMILHHDMFHRDLDRLEDLLTGSVTVTETETELGRFWAYARGGTVKSLAEDEVAPYSTLMRQSQAMMADAILTAHDFGGYRRLLDLGGGDGAFLAAAGADYPRLELLLFDLPAVAERARRHLAEQGLAGRSGIMGGDFHTDTLPDAADAVILIRILCDHDDEAVRHLLVRLHQALRPGTTIIIAEAMAGPSDGAKLAAVYFSTYFLAMGSGRCRSAQAIRDLLTEAGFRSPRIQACANPLLATIVSATR